MNIVYSPTYTLLAAGILLIIPIVFHVIAFRKSIRFIHILTSILVGNFILAFVSEIAGLAHFFDAKVILAISLLIAGVAGYWINKKGFFYNKNITGNNISKTSIILVFAFAIFIFLYQKNTFPPFTPDTLAAYLSWARIIVNECAIPAFHLETNAYYTIPLPPLLYTNIAFLFSFFDDYIDSIPAAIPIIHLSFFVFLITNWGEEFKDRGVPLFILLALLLAPSTHFAYLGSRVLQEAPLLFFATASFYLLFKYLRTETTLFLVLLSISSALMALTKQSGLLISFMLFCILVIKVKEKKEMYNILTIFPLFHIPAIIWVIRSIYFFNNPVYPSFEGIFGSIYLGLGPLLPVGGGSQTSFPRLFTYFFITFPAFIFTIFYMIRNRRNIEVQYTAGCFVVFLICLYLSGWRLLARYLYPFLGIFAVYAGIEMSRLYDKISIEVIKKKKKVILAIAIILCCMIQIMVPIPGIYLSDIKSGNYKLVMSDLNLSDFDPVQPYISREWINKIDVVEYMQNKEDKGLIIAGLYDVDFFTWYGGYTAINPKNDRTFRKLNYDVNKKRFDFTKNSTHIYNNLKKMGVDYIYTPPCPLQWEVRFNEILHDKINQDPEHFELVYNENGYRLWKIKE
jgi:hypothetical protein